MSDPNALVRLQIELLQKRERTLQQQLECHLADVQSCHRDITMCHNDEDELRKMIATEENEETKQDMEVQLASIGAEVRQLEAFRDAALESATKHRAELVAVRAEIDALRAK